MKNLKNCKFQCNPNKIHNSRFVNFYDKVNLGVRHGKFSPIASEYKRLKEVEIRNFLQQQLD